MPSKYAWEYYLIIPASAASAANAVSAALSNPSGITATFRRYPRPNSDGIFLLPATHWAASFLATDLSSDGVPSRQALEGYLSKSLMLKTVLWARCKNRYHIDTPEDDKGVVVASNWALLPIGAKVGWDAVSAAIALL